MERRYLIKDAEELKSIQNRVNILERNYTFKADKMEVKDSLRKGIEETTIILEGLNPEVSPREIRDEEGKEIRQANLIYGSREKIVLELDKRKYIIEFK